MSANPINSSIFDIPFSSPYLLISKSYIISLLFYFVDKYLLIVLMFMIAGMGIGITRSPPQLSLFYTMLAGAIAILIYSSYKNRKEQQELRRQKRRSKK